MSIVPQDPDSKTYHPSTPPEAQQDDGCSCGSTALLTHDHDPSCTLVGCRRCGMDLPDHLPGDDHCRPCTRPHLDAARPSADTEALRHLAAEFDANGNSRPLGDPSAGAWHKAAARLRAALDAR